MEPTGISRASGLPARAITVEVDLYGMAFKLASFILAAKPWPLPLLVPAQLPKVPFEPPQAGQIGEGQGQDGSLPGAGRAKRPR